MQRIGNLSHNRNFANRRISVGRNIRCIVNDTARSVFSYKSHLFESARGTRQEVCKIQSPKKSKVNREEVKQVNTPAE